MPPGPVLSLEAAMPGVTPPVEVPAPAQRFRRLRIAISVFFCAIAIVLCVLWVRSYRSGDYLYWNIYHHRSVVVGSENSRVIVHTQLFEISGSRLRFISKGIFWLTFQWDPLSGSPFKHIYNGFQSEIPYWFLTAAALTVSVFSWMPFSTRFGLRQLFVVTTVVAVVLGLVCYASR